MRTPRPSHPSPSVSQRAAFDWKTVPLEIPVRSAGGEAEEVIWQWIRGKVEEAEARRATWDWEKDPIEYDERDGMNLFRSVRAASLHPHCLPCPYQQPRGRGGP